MARKPRGKTAGPSVLARYDAASQGRRMRGWTPPGSGPNKAIQGLQTIRNRARDATRNDWSGEAAITRWTTNLIGTGIVPRVKKSVSAALRDRGMAAWNEWVKDSDADSVLNFYGQQTLAVRGWLDGGEMFVRLRPRRAEFGLAVPLQVQLVEGEFVPLLDSDSDPRMPVGNRIRSGIELNRSGQRVAYWMHREHPGDDRNVIDMDRLLRVPADQVKHIFEPKRAGQLRGVSQLAPVLARLRSVADFDDAVLERQKLANLFTAFITRAGFDPDGDIDPMTNAPISYDTDGTPMVGLEPGMVQELGHGEDIKFANPPEAGTTYPDYMRSQHLGTAAGANLPYEIFSGDIKEVSDRTLRVVINEFRRFAEQRQWQIVIPMLCEFVRNAWCDAAWLSGEFSFEEAQQLKQVDWSPQGWQYIHPVQDVTAKQTEVMAGFRSRSSVIAERGDDPEVVDAERATDQERAEKLGLPDTTSPAPAAGSGSSKPKSDNDNIAPGEYPTAIERLMSASAKQLDVFRETVNVLTHAAPPPAPQGITINNHIPHTTVTNSVNPTPVTITNEVNPTPVTVNNEVNPTPVTVNNEVNPTPVNVASPNVVVNNDVQPAEVKVQLPDRKTESTIKRDGDGNIIKVTQVEKDLP